MGLVLGESLRAWWPEACLGLGSLLAVLLSAFVPAKTVRAVAWAALAASALALWRTTAPTPTDIFYGVIVCDALGLAFRWLALGTVALVLLMVVGAREIEEAYRGEAIGLLLFVGFGLLLLSEANHLLMAYLALELVSLGSYLLVGFLPQRRSAEAALKYLLFGALASGVMLFGMSLLFGLTGELSFPALASSLAGIGSPMREAALLAALLMLVGVAFKISMVPFHLWTPDVYEGAPVAVTAFLSVGPKVAGLALLLRLCEVLQPLWPALAPMVLGLTVLTMTLGNLAALTQTNVKRLLAYSTIAQVGYLLIGFVVQTPAGLQALIVYLTAYLFMNLGLFACVQALVNDTGQESLTVFQGLYRRAPWLALSTALFLLSLAGLPPLFGFIGKFMLFDAAIQTGQGWLAIAAILNSAMAVYYYVNIIRLMYAAPTGATTALRPCLGLRVAAGVCVAAVLGLGLWPSPLLARVQARLSVEGRAYSAIIRP
jgi:NADH-quinone oxidoreductase subunit N